MIKNTRKVIILLVTTLLIGLAALIIILYNNSSNQETIDPVVRLSVGLNYGTATHLGNGYFLTANHIFQNITTQTATIRTTTDSEHSIEILWRSDLHDILYFRVNDTLELDSYSIDCSPLEFGTELRLVGYPLTLPYLASAWGRVSGSPIQRNTPPILINPINTMIVPGMSGGPALDSSNNIRGINVSVMPYIPDMMPYATSFTTQSHIVSSSEICNLLGIP
jgi:hypothetical protein